MLVYKTLAEASTSCSAGIRTATTAAATCAVEIRTGANRVSVREIWTLNTSGTPGNLGLGRPQARGITPSTTAPFLAQDPDDEAPLSVLATAWATQPTVPVDFLRRIYTLNGNGSGVWWTFGPRELIVEANASLVLWNIAINVVQEVVVVLEED